VKKLDNIIGFRIKDLRMSLGKTQEELGNLMHVKKQTVSKWENGINIPDSNTLRDLSDILQCSTDYLVGKVDIPNHVHIEHDDPDVGMVEFNYPYKLTPAEVQEMVDTLKKYHFDIDALVEDMRKKENEEK
jgi:transcriptional regulator with XRE-family HTH domain